MAVRWDAVVEASRFWAEPQPARAPETPAGTPVAVQVRLFGRLAPPGAARSLELAMTTPFSLRDVLAELGRRSGDDLAAQAALRPCRIFVDGVAAQDLDAPLAARAASIEMILLTGIEGG